MRLSEGQIAQAALLRQQGRSLRQIAGEFNVAPSTLMYALRRYDETGLYTRRPGSGRRRCTTSRDDRFTALQSLRNRFLTAVELRRQLQLIRGVDVSERTVRRRLKEADLRSRRPARCLELLRCHRMARLRFAQEHASWTIEQWKSVLFTDECRVALRAPDGRERVYRRRGERYLANTTRQVTSFHGGSVMVWGGITSDARTELAIVNGPLNAERYVRDILQEHVIPHMESVGAENFVLMHDNARPHAARSVETFLTQVGVQKLQWPARSPDLNPIEHVWDMLKRRVKNGPNAAQTLSELKTALTSTWREIPQADMKKVVETMPDRMRAVINARGGNTSY